MYRNIHKYFNLSQKFKSIFQYKSNIKLQTGISFTWVITFRLFFIDTFSTRHHVARCSNNLNGFFQSEVMFENLKVTLREKSPNTELFLVRIFPHLDWIQRDTWYLSVASSNAGNYGPEITPYLDTFHTVFIKQVFSIYKQQRWHFCYKNPWKSRNIRSEAKQR